MRVVYGNAISVLSIRAFFEGIDRNLFTPEFGTYEYMTFFNDPTAFKILVLGIYFGLIVAALATYYNKQILGGFIRTLDARGCLSPQSALGLGELGYLNNPFIKLSLRFGYTLRRVVSVVCGSGEDGEMIGVSLIEASLKKRRSDLKNDKLYIPESKRDVTVQRFYAKGSGVLSLILTIAIGLAAVIVIFKLAPFVVRILENTAAGFHADSGI